MRRGRAIIATFAVLLLASACSDSGDSGSSASPGGEGLKDVTLRLDWIITGEHTEFYVAREKGFFADQGLNVTIKEGAGSSVALKLVGNGTDDFGFAGFGPLTLAQQEGVEAKMVMGVYRKAPHAIFALESSNITTVADLKGKTLGTTAGSAPLILLPPLLAQAGLSEADVKVVSLDPAATIPALCAGKVDAITGDIQSEGPVVKTSCKEPVTEVDYGDSGVGIMGHGIVVNPSMIDSDPDTVQAFVTAMQNSIEWTQDNADEAIKIMHKLFPQTVPLDTGAGQLAGVLSLLNSAETEGQPIGWISPDQVNLTIELLQKYGGLEDPKPPEDYYTNEFVEQ